MTVLLNAPDDWLAFASWSPDVTAGTLQLFGRIDGGAWFLMDSAVNASSDYSFEFNPNDFASPGDSLGLFIQATDVSGCPDFASNVITNVVS